MKKILLILVSVFVLLSCVACTKPVQHTEKPDISVEEIELPSDFSFSIQWGIHYSHSYDSKTGKLVNENNASDVSKHTTYVLMSENELKAVYKYLCYDIDLTTYPDTYDPINDPKQSSHQRITPSQTIIISVTANGKTKTVTCPESAIVGDNTNGYNDDAVAFLVAKNNVISLIASFPEYQALPESDILYM